MLTVQYCTVSTEMPDGIKLLIYCITLHNSIVISVHLNVMIKRYCFLFITHNATFTMTIDA